MYTHEIDKSQATSEKSMNIFCQPYRNYFRLIKSAILESNLFCITSLFVYQIFLSFIYCRYPDVLVCIIILTIRYVHIISLITFQGTVLFYEICQRMQLFQSYQSLFLAFYNKQEKALLTRLDHLVFYNLFIYVSYSVQRFSFHAFFTATRFC